MRAKAQTTGRTSDEAAKLAASMTVRAETPVSSESSFCDPVWRMSSMTHLPSAKESSKSWDFRSVPGFPGGFALALAEFAYHRLYKPVASHDRQGQWLTVHNELVALRTFAKFCAAVGYESFAELDSEAFYDFHSNLTNSSDGRGAMSAERAGTIVFTLYRLWEYRSALSQPLQALPFGKQMDTFRKRGGYVGENRTPAIPEEIFGPLAAAALDYVLEFRVQILGAFNELRSRWADEIALTALTENGKKKRLARVTKLVLRKFPASWRKAAWQGLEDLDQELHQLRRACTITILAFSGIRVSELLSLESNCCVQDVLDGGRVRYYINTVIHKHRGIGARDTWVVIREVVQAIEVLEQLTADMRAASGTNKLFLSTNTNSSFSVSNDPVAADALFGSSSLVYQVNAFLEVGNKNLARSPIPSWTDGDGNTKPWHLNLRQFRRTLARYIAREPFGIIAGMLQYKHVEVTCFEGYAGSEPSWNKMLSEEKVLASVNLLDELAMDLSDGAIAGPVGKELRARFETDFKGRADDYPPSQIAKWLADQKTNLYVGKFNFCFFNEEKALCTAKSTRKDVPILNACDPNHCGNACVTKKHVPLWKAQLEQAEQLLLHPKASPLQKVALRNEVAELSRVVQDVEKGAV